GQDPKRAVDLARQAVGAEPADYRDALWLGQLCADAKQPPAQIEALYRRAVKLAPIIPETWLTLVRFLAVNNRGREAEAELQKAQAALPADQVALTLARAYEGLGQNDRAEKQYEIALHARPTDAAVWRTAANFFIQE